MRFRVHQISDVFGGSAKFFSVKIFSIIAAMMLGIALSVASSSASDLVPQPTDGLSVTNSATKLLPQTQAAESSWLSGLHVSGYASQTFGMWQNPHNTHEWTHSSNALAVSRTLLQVDENYRLNENNTFFAREWFVYEPVYAFNSSNNVVDSAIQNAYVSPFCATSPACRVHREVAPSPVTSPMIFTINIQCEISGGRISGDR